MRIGPCTSTSPLTPTTSDDLTCQAGLAVDPDGDVVSVTYGWVINGTPSPVPGPSLSSTQFVSGDLVWCETTPSDGDLTGPTVSSNVASLERSARLQVAVMVTASVMAMLAAPEGNWTPWGKSGCPLSTHPSGASVDVHSMVTTSP